MLRILAVSIMVAALAVVSSAQSNSKQIQFAKGQNSTVEKFTLPAGDGITYIFGVKKDNLMKFMVSGLYTDGTDGQGLTIKLRKLGAEKVLKEASPGEEIEYQFINGGGDYEIEVMNPGRKRAKITLNLEINPETSADSDVCDGCDNPNDAEAERITLAKGQSDVDVDVQIEGRETKKFVAFVAKGYMTCIVPDTNLGSGVTIKVNGKVLNPNNGPCTAHATAAGDQIIEFINNGNREKGFTASIGFHQHN